MTNILLKLYKVSETLFRTEMFLDEDDPEVIRLRKELKDCKAKASVRYSPEVIDKVISCGEDSGLGNGSESYWFHKVQSLGF
jgi:hypothetical protein